MSRRLRVGMNLLWLRPGVVGGSEVAAVSTVDALDRHAPEDVELVLYAQRSFPGAHPDQASRVPTRTVPGASRNRGVRVALESSWLPLALTRDRVDVAHCYGGVVPPVIGRPSVLTLHDLQPLEPGSAFSAVKKRWLSAMIPASVARAAVVAVPSAFVRSRTVDLLGTDPDKVVVVPHGLDTAMALGATPDAVALRRRFRLDGPFVLYPAITYPHKNHAILVRAFARLAERHRHVALVLAGGAEQAEDELVRTVERLGVGDRVRRVGRVTTTERDALVREAAVLAFPSRYEGFGLPVLEAFAADTPVVAAAAGSLPEVVGDAGGLVDPDDLDGWVGALDAALDGHDTGADASRRRHARLDHFTWERAAAALVGTYRRAAGQGDDR